jgi:hypothetical protein
MARAHKKTAVYIDVPADKTMDEVYSTIEQIEGRTSISVVYSSLLESGVESKFIEKHMKLIDHIAVDGKTSKCGNIITCEIPSEYFTALVGSRRDVKEFKEEALGTIGYLQQIVSPRNGAVYFTGRNGKQGQSKTYSLDITQLKNGGLTFKISYTQSEVHDIKTNNYIIDENNLRMVQAVQNTEIDVKAAMIDELYNKDNEVKFVHRLNNMLSLVSKQRSIVKSELTGRVTHSLSNVSKISRKHLHIDGLRYTEVDVRNCQPLLLVALIKDNELAIDNSFVSAVENGVVYDMLIGTSGKFIKFDKDGDIVSSGERVLSTRESVKEEFFSAILFDLKYHSPLLKKFKEVFPQTFTSIKQLHSGDITLAAKLQRMESDIFNTLYPASGYFFTLYDAIFVTDESSIPQLIECIEKKFDKFGLKVKINVNKPSVIHVVHYL